MLYKHLEGPGSTTLTHGHASMHANMQARTCYDTRTHTQEVMTDTRTHTQEVMTDTCRED